MIETSTNKITFTIAGINEVIEESQNQYTALREIRWGDRNPTLELRRWRESPAKDGSKNEEDDYPLKGVTFLTPEGPNTLAETLVGLGFGSTKDILNNIKDRDDFRKSLNTVLGKGDEYYDESAGELDDEYYDPSELMKL